MLKVAKVSELHWDPASATLKGEVAITGESPMEKAFVCFMLGAFSLYPDNFTAAAELVKTAAAALAIALPQT